MTDDFVDKFRQLLSKFSQPGKNVGLEFLLEELEQAHLLRLCAIPHLFSPAVLRVLDPALDEKESETACDEFAGLSVVRAAPEGLSLLDDDRHYLFRQWLEPEHLNELSAVSERLAQYYQDYKDEGAGNQAAAERMFHLVPVNQPEALSLFEKLFQMRRNELRVGECDLLVEFMHEYDILLTPSTAASLSYHEGTLAADRYQWERAEKLFHETLGNSALTKELAIKTKNRLGMLYAAQRKWQEAIEYYQEALSEAAASSESYQERYMLLHDLGVVYRDSGLELDRAEELLRESIELAEPDRNFTGAATAYNSLGTLYLKFRDNEQAAKAYNKSLALLEATGENLKRAQVLNNLGLVYNAQDKYDKSRHYFEQSIKITERVGDTLNLAKSLLNLGHACWKMEERERAVENIEQACGKFKEMRNHYLQAFATRDLARYYQQLGRDERASQAYMSAIELLEKSGEYEQAQRTRKELASAYP